MRRMQARLRHDPTKTMVGFVVGDVQYAVPIGQVREISNPLSVVELPRAPASVVGVADYRGEVVPVVDLRGRFGLPPAPPSRRTKWLVVDVGQRFVALVVDAATEVFGTGGSEVQAAPSLGGGEDARGIAGVTSFGNGLVFVLDVSRFRGLTEPLAAQGLLKPSQPAPSLPSRAPR